MAMGIYQLQCPYGTMEDLKDFGVNPKGKKAMNGKKAEPDYSKNQACIQKKEFGNLEASSEQ